MYPSDIIFEGIFEFSETESPIEHFENLGYEGSNFVMMSGSLLINICITVSLSIVLHIIDFVCRKFYKFSFARNVGSKIVKSSAIGAIITFYLQGYLEMLICCITSIREMKFNQFEKENGSDKFAYIFSVGSLVLLGLLLIFVTFMSYWTNRLNMIELKTFLNANMASKTRAQ